MSQKPLNRRDAETIMIALDQVSQTIDVLDGVVNRLKLYLQARLDHDDEPRLRTPASSATTSTSSTDKTGEHDIAKDLPIH